MKRALVALLAAGPLALAACGSSAPDPTPDACLQGEGAYLEALRAAPDPVRLGGAVPISDCLVAEQRAGELATVGTAMVAAATRLNARARRRSDGPAATELGYLLGAVERGASRTGGIHTDLGRRLDAAARFGGFSGELERRFGTGYAAGRADG